jgi:hypothetical protein
MRTKLLQLIPGVIALLIDREDGTPPIIHVTAVDDKLMGPDFVSIRGYRYDAKAWYEAQSYEFRRELNEELDRMARSV